MKTVKCPTCRKAFDWDAQPAFRPFCSERCKLIDLGDWFEEKHRIPDRSATKNFSPPDEDLH